MSNIGIRDWFKGERRGWENGDQMERQGSWWSLFAPTPATSGQNVNERNALQLATVYACIRIIAETIASLPVSVYKPGAKPGAKDSLRDHPLYKVVHDEANDEMTSFSFWETVIGHYLSWGNAYAEIERDGAGRVVALWPISPDSVTVDRKGGRIVYRVNPTKEDSLRPEIILPADKVLHFHGLGFDGLVGYSPIQMQRELLGFSRATEVYGSTFFGNGAKPGGVLETEQVLKDEKVRDRLREGWQDIHGGAGKAHRVAVLEAGMKYKPISLPPNDAQFLETRRWNKEEIAQIFRVPLHLLGDLQRATFSNIEHQSIEFVVHTIRPYLVRMEQELRRKLLTPSEKKSGMYVEWNVDGLLRGDAKSRNESLQIQRQNGVINANEWRSYENLNPIEGPEGEDYLVNGAMVPVKSLDAVIQVKLNPPAPKGGENNGQGTAKPPAGGGGGSAES